MTLSTTPFGLRYSMAQGLFDRGEFASAAVALADLLADVESATDPTAAGDLVHGTTDVQLLLARAFFGSAQLGRAESLLRTLIEQAPTDAYAQLLLGRTLQRAGRHDEAAGPLALAEIYGGYDRPEAFGA